MVSRGLGKSKMGIKAQTTIRALQPVVAALQMLGHKPDPLLLKAGIPLNLLQDADGYLPHKNMMAFWDIILTEIQDDCLGIHLAEIAPIQSFEIHAHALLSSASLRDAFRRACHYQRLIHEVTDLTLEETPDEGIIRHNLPGGKSVPRHPAEFLVTLWVRLGRLVTGNNWSPRLVCFAHETPNNTSEHQRIFAANIAFSSGKTAIYVPNSILDLSNPKANIGLSNLLDNYADLLLKQSKRQQTFADQVRAWIAEELNGGTPNARNAAEAMNMSVRTLHRDLKSKGTSFGELLNSLRQERAVILLANPKFSITEVAFLLGFSELSSFYRAFKRWTGKTPAQYRASVLIKT